MTQIETPPAAPAPEPQARREWSPEEQRQAFIRLIVIVVAGVLAAVVTGVTKTVLVVFALILMIMLHELGHFMTAKWAGMKVTEYFLGFGPRLWSVRRGETAPAWLNAANEVAVAAFLDGLIPWAAIAEVIAETMAEWPGTKAEDVGVVLEQDARARHRAGQAVERRSQAA